MSLRGSAAPLLARAEEELRPFQLRDEKRVLMTVLAGEPQEQPTRLWRMSAASISALQGIFTDGLFDYPLADWDSGWCEDPTFYREGAVMLGVVSHEGEGLLTVSESEHAEVQGLGIPTHQAPRTYPHL